MHKTIAAAVMAVAVGIAGTAHAADIIVPVPVATVTIVPAPVETGFDWTGAYAGVQGGTWFGLDPLAFDSFRAAVVTGATVEVGGRLVVGAEAVGGIYIYPGEVLFEAYGLARAGVLLGERFLVYAAAGAGFDFDPISGGAIMLFGGGAEVAAGRSISIRGETLALRYFGEPLSFVSGTVSLVWHFGGR